MASIRFYLHGGTVRDKLLQIERKAADVDMLAIYDSSETTLSAAMWSTELLYPGRCFYKNLNRGLLRFPKLDIFFLPSLESHTSDFTINSIVTTLDNQPVAYHSQAVRDLALRVLRPSYDNAIADDITRVFRAVRFEHKLGLTPHKSAIAQVQAVSDDQLAAAATRYLLQKTTRTAIAKSTMLRPTTKLRLFEAWAKLCWK